MKRRSYKYQRKIMNHVWGKPKRFYFAQNKEKGKDYQKKPESKIEKLENKYDRLFFAESYKEAAEVYSEILLLKAITK